MKTSNTLAVTAILGLCAITGAVNAQTVNGVILGPPRVETVGTPPIEFWWAKVTGGGLETACASRADFTPVFGPHPTDNSTNGIVYQMMDETGKRNYDAAFAGALVNKVFAGNPITFDLVYQFGGATFSNECIVSDVSQAQ